MSVRSWLYHTLKDDPDLFAIHGGRVFQGESLTTAIVPKPFLVYRLGNDTDENLGGEGEDDPQPHRSFFQVYFHDEPGDYDLIDTMVVLTKLALRRRGPSKEEGIIAVRYLETSRDLDDVTFGSITRYSRFQWILS